MRYVIPLDGNPVPEGGRLMRNLVLDMEVKGEVLYIKKAVLKELEIIDEFENIAKCIQTRLEINESAFKN